jgi:hypothetical protein
VYGGERKFGSQNTPGGSSSADTGPSKQSGVHEHQSDHRAESLGHHKLRVWKDVDSSLPSARRACTCPETPTSRRTSAQVQLLHHGLALVLAQCTLESIILI